VVPSPLQSGFVKHVSLYTNDLRTVPTDLSSRITGLTPSHLRTTLRAYTDQVRNIRDVYRRVEQLWVSVLGGEENRAYIPPDYFVFQFLDDAELLTGRPRLMDILQQADNPNDFPVEVATQWNTQARGETQMYGSYQVIDPSAGSDMRGAARDDAEGETFDFGAYGGEDTQMSDANEEAHSSSAGGPSDMADLEDL
jgi:hypothetical protein